MYQGSPPKVSGRMAGRDLFDKAADLLSVPIQNEICFLNAAGDNPPRHGGVTADCKHLLLNDIRHFTGALDMEYSC